MFFLEYFLDLDMTKIWGEIILCYGLVLLFFYCYEVILCTAGCLAATLASAHQMPVVFSLLHYN